MRVSKFRPDDADLAIVGLGGRRQRRVGAGDSQTDQRVTASADDGRPAVGDEALNPLGVGYNLPIECSSINWYNYSPFSEFRIIPSVKSGM